MGNVGSIEELRRVCQDPVRHNNDLAGALYGWRVSIYVTSLFLRLGLSANTASVLMLASGLSGSLLLLLPGWGRVAGAALVTAAFILDCVDGEIARYHGIDSFRWAAFDYIHHMTVKALSFLCLGIGAWLEFGNPWTMALGGIGSVFWLMLMAIRDLGPALFTKKIVQNDGRSGNPAYRRLVDNLKRVAADESERPSPEDESVDVWGKDFRFRPWMIRTALVSFDIAAPLLLVAALLDRLVGAEIVFELAVAPTTALLALYAVLLPVHAIDLLYVAMRKGELRDELYDLARRVERFRKEK
ncbi:MAG: hypothetical protein ACF8XB_15585 [Planctomycetota bacterium JB042]